MANNDFTLHDVFNKYKDTIMGGFLTAMKEEGATPDLTLRVGGRYFRLFDEVSQKEKANNAT